MVKSHGGKRDGAGRKPGSKNAIKRKLLNDVLSDKDKKEIVEKALEVAKNGDSKLLQYFMDQIHGKAATPIDIDLKSGITVQIEDLTSKSLTKLRKEN